MNSLITQDNIIMNSASPVGHGQGQHIDRIPLFNGEYYYWWTTRMEDFIQAKDYELWVRITYGPLTPILTDSEGNKVHQPTDKNDDADYKIVEKNAKAKGIFVCGLGPNEFNRI